MTWIRSSCSALGLLAVCLLPASAHSAGPGSAASVRLGFVFNFAKFVAWPEGAGGKEVPLRICVAPGDEAMNKALPALEAGDINGRRVVTRALTPQGDPRECQVLFVPAAQAATDTIALLDRLQGSPTLTVSDGENFMRQGGMIELVYTDSRYQFDINYVAAKKANLSLSSGLLKLARTVK